MRAVPDILAPGLDVVFVGFNPSLPSAHAGHHYANPRNYFYRLLHSSGLTPRLFAPPEDGQLLRYGIGLTNLTDMPSRTISDLPRGALSAGRDVLRQKLEQCAPKVVCFNGLLAYRAFFGRATAPGLQPDHIGTSRVFVVPSTSPANNALMAERERSFAELARLLGRLPLEQH